MWNFSTNNDELRTLLENLYPDVHIANKGVALLAAQIRNLENKSDLVGNQIDHTVHRTVMMVATIHPRTNYGTDNYPK